MVSKNFGTILSLLAALLILEGIPYFIFPSKVKEWAALLQSIPAAQLRVMGFFIIMAGLLVLYVANM